MKIRIPENVPAEAVPEYLTKGKVYDARRYIDDPEWSDDIQVIYNDYSETTIVNLSHCPHLEYDAWEVVEEADANQWDDSLNLE